MSSIGGQQEIITVPDITDRINEPKGKENETRKRGSYMDFSPPPKARAPHLELIMSTPPSLYNSDFSSRAPQVESYMDHALTNAERLGTTCAKLWKSPTPCSGRRKPESRTATQVPRPASKSFTSRPLLRSLNPPRVFVAKPVSKRSRSSKTSMARKIIVPAQGRGDISTAQEPKVDSRTARRQNRSTKLQLNDIAPSAPSAIPSMTMHAR
jgi:hypothetical protein